MSQTNIMLAFMKGGFTYQKPLNCNNINAALLPRSPYGVAYTPDRLVAGFAFEIQTGQHAFGSDRISPFFTPPNTLAFTPVGCDVFSKSETGGEYLTIALDEKKLDDLFERQNTYAHRYNNAANKQAITLAEKLRNQILLAPTDILGIEETALEFFEIAAFNTNTASSQRKPASSMTEKRWRLFHDRLEEDLSTPFGLEQFAKDLDLSASFFIRAFRAATGSTPHAYIIRRRLNAARRKLTQRTTSIAGIASETGFANQAHMTSVFSRHLGLTPRKYQQLRA